MSSEEEIKEKCIEKTPEESLKEEQIKYMKIINNYFEKYMKCFTNVMKILFLKGKPSAKKKLYDALNKMKDPRDYIMVHMRMMEKNFSFAEGKSPETIVDIINRKLDIINVNMFPNSSGYKFDFVKGWIKLKKLKEDIKMELCCDLILKMLEFNKKVKKILKERRFPPKKFKCVKKIAYDIFGEDLVEESKNVIDTSLKLFQKDDKKLQSIITSGDMGGLYKYLGNYTSQLSEEIDFNDKKIQGNIAKSVEGTLSRMSTSKEYRGLSSLITNLIKGMPKTMIEGEEGEQEKILSLLNKKDKRSEISKKGGKRRTKLREKCKFRATKMSPGEKREMKKMSKMVKKKCKKFK